MPMIFIIWFATFPFILEFLSSQGVNGGDWIQMENLGKRDHCLAFVQRTLSIEKCQVDEVNQLWRLDDDGRLRNNGTGTCLNPSDLLSIPCAEANKRWTCLPFVLKAGVNSYLGADPAVFKYKWHYGTFDDDLFMRSRWKRYGNHTSICDYTAQIWRGLNVRPSEKIETGLNTLLTGVMKEASTFIWYLMMHNKPKKLVPFNFGFISVSVGPTGIWAISSEHVSTRNTRPEIHTFWISNKNAKENDTFSPNLDSPFIISSRCHHIDVGPTGIVNAINGSHICSRVGINDTTPQGTAWNCKVGSATLLTCGIDGCFFVNSVNITYEPKSTTQNRTQFGTPFIKNISDIDAGLNYELWVVTETHDVYRRVGTNASSPCGSHWELVPGVQLRYISIGIFGPIATLAFPGQYSWSAVILNGIPTPKRQQKLDRLCNDIFKTEAWLARFDMYSSVSASANLRCYPIGSLTVDTQGQNTQGLFEENPLLQTELFRRPLYGRNETQMWLDQMCNDPDVNRFQGSKPSVLNFFAYYDETLKCRSILFKETIANELERFIRMSCAQIPLGFDSGMFPALGFRANSSLFKYRPRQARLQNGSSGWCSNQTHNYLEIDFFFMHKICALKLGGEPKIDRWKLQYASNRKHWFDYIQHLNGRDEETQILPVYIKARYLRFRPIMTGGSSSYCLKLEVYGSSQAFTADSCAYYKKQLSATKDSIYIIYPRNATKRELVYCTGFRYINHLDIREFPITLPDLKLHWNLNSTKLRWKGGCSTCSNLTGDSGILLPFKSTASLGDFRGTCISDPDTCLNGLSIEMWLWFADYNHRNNSNVKSVLLKSGSEHSKGFQLSFENTTMSFKVYTAKKISECHMRITNFGQWIHVVGTWLKNSTTSQLYANNVNAGCVAMRERNRAGVAEDLDGDLMLGPIGKIDKSFVLLQNLSVWMRSMNDTERQSLFHHSQSITTLPDPWSGWSNCTKACQKTRSRKCRFHDCDIQITETRTCYDIRECAPPSNCDELLKEGYNNSGQYSVRLRPDFSSEVRVFCEQTFQGGGWLVVLKRTSASLNFNRSWSDYKNGFGEAGGDHWIGNEKLHQLTKEGGYKLIVNFYDNQTLIASTSCNSFYVTSEEANYAGSFKLCKGPASHALTYSNGAKFSTSERDNDLSEENCALKNGGGGFWYKNCSMVSFTGQVVEGSPHAVSYLTENGSVVTAPTVIMMIKPCQKDYLEMNMVIKFVGEKWSDELASDSSHAFFLLAGKIKRNLEAVYRNDGTYVTTTVNLFRPGSVIANITIAYTEINNTQIITLLYDLRGGYLNGEMPVSFNDTDFTIINPSVANERPNITELYNSSSTSFHIAWSQLSNTTGIKGYRIFYKNVSNQHWLMYEANEHATEANVSGLEIFTKYFVVVLAYTATGNGVPSAIHYVTTDEDVPEAGPANLTTYWNKTDQTVLVKWSHIPRPLIRGYFTHYVVNYSSSTNSTRRISRTNSIVLAELSLFTVYTIRVAGSTRIGAGVESVISYRTRGLPLPAPKKLIAMEVTGSIINVTWSHIPNDPGFDQAAGYRIYYFDQTELKNITIPANRSHITITDVKQNVAYDITVAGLTIENQEGRRVHTSIIIKNITAPERPPVNLTCPGLFPYSISVGWHGYTAEETGGSLKGYLLSYSVKGNSTKNMTELKPHPPWITLDNLRVQTEYEISVLVFNEKGRGPLANITCKTKEGAPKEKPQNFQAHSFVGANFITLSWEHVNYNSTRRGYKLFYQTVLNAGSKVAKSTVESLVFPADATNATVTGLDLFSKYCFQLLVFNEDFDGVRSERVCAETCRCPRRFFTNWFVQDPYVLTSNLGIFPPIVKQMIDGVCRPCKEYNDTVFTEFAMDGRGEKAEKDTLELVQFFKVTKETQVSFPVIGPKTGLTGRAGAFIPVIDSPSAVFIIPKPSVTKVAQFVIGKTLVNTLPLLGLTFVLMLLGAILIWSVESIRNEDTFPKPFFKGVQQGIWWAFVSVTTVGYGDKLPKSILGRLFSIIWILYGTVFIGVLIVALTSALTVTMVVISKDVTLYGSQVAAISGSWEVQLGLLKGAHVNKGRNFSNVSSILKAVENGDVDGALVDKLTAARLPALRDPNGALVIKNVIPKSATYGIYLTGHAASLHRKFRNYLRNNPYFVIRQIANYTQPLKQWAVSTNFSQTDDATTDYIISASSPIFLPLLYWITGVLVFVVIVGLAWHFIYYKHVASAGAAAAKKNQVSMMSDSKMRASSLQQFMRDFCDETYQKLKETRARHIKELRALKKLKSS